MSAEEGEEETHALCLGLYMLSIRDGAEDFQTWQADHDLPDVYTDRQLREAQYEMPDDYDRLAVVETATAYLAEHG